MTLSFIPYIFYSDRLCISFQIEETPAYFLANHHEAGS